MTGLVPAARRRAGVERLTDRTTFERLRREGLRGASGPITVTWLADDAERRRVAYAIGRRVGTAVMRNRIRRRLRAIVAQRAAELPAGAWLIRVGPEAAGQSSAELAIRLMEAVDRAARAEQPR